MLSFITNFTSSIHNITVVLLLAFFPPDATFTGTTADPTIPVAPPVEVRAALSIAPFF